MSGAIPCTFRVDVTGTGKTKQEVYDKISECLEKYDKYFTKYIIGYELSEKVQKFHFQGVIYTLQKFNTYKTEMNKFFVEWKGKDESKKGKRSFVERKKEEYDIYVCKDNDIQFVKGFTEEDIKELFEKSYKKKVDNTYPHNGDKKKQDAMILRLFHSLPKTNRHLLTMNDIAIHVAYHYLKNVAYPQDNFARSLVKGLYIMCGDKDKMYRAAQLSNLWLDPELRLTSDEIRKYYRNDEFEEDLVWDPIENDVVLETKVV